MEEESPKYDEEVERCLLYGNTHSHLYNEIINLGIYNYIIAIILFTYNRYLIDY